MLNTASNSAFSAPLHGLRGIAALYVVVSHLGNEGAFLIPINHDAVGKVGVWIFFALSAFLLTAHLYKDFMGKASHGGPLMQYAVNRVFRIYPLYLLVIAAHVVVRDISFSEALRHALLVEGWGELWAIPVEFQYYLLIPLVALAAVKLSPAVTIALLAIGIVGSVCYGVALPESVFSNQLNIVPRLAPFLTGSALAIAMSGNTVRDPILKRTVSSLIVTVSMVGLIGMTVFYRWMSKGELPESSSPWISLILGISVVGLIHGSLQSGIFGTLLGARALVFLGEISFSLYLWHMFFIRLVTRLAHWPDVVEAWVSLALSIVFAYASYRIVEKPGIRAGRRIAQYLRAHHIGLPPPLPSPGTGKSGPL